MYLIEYEILTSDSTLKMKDTFADLESAYKKFSYYQGSDSYTSSKLYKLVPIEVKLSAVEVIEEI